MYVDFYEKISKPIRRSKNGAVMLAITNKALVALTGAAFICFLLWLCLNMDPRAIRFLIVCATSFGACTLVRNVLNYPRPYELYPIDVLIEKDTTGKTLPSRHVFSATIISCGLFWLNTPAGIVGFGVTLILAIIRVVGGVHFPKDVIVGIAFGLICGALGFWII